MHVVQQDSGLPQAKVEVIILKAACYLGSNSSDIYDTLGEPGHTPLFVGFPITWGSMEGDCMISLHFVGQLLNWGT
jgi:hypothetical protein